jgi:branched-chain amino acid transport system permease protein
MVEYGIFFLTFVGIYGLLALGLNLQWGLTGLFNIGIAGFFAVGSYVAAIVTTAPNPVHLGGLGWPIPVGLLAAMASAGILALGIGLLTIRLRSDYLAIASIGIAEIIRLILTNEDWLGNGVRGIPAIPRPFDGSDLAMLAVVVACVVLTYLALERARRSPWGRVLRAIREREAAAEAMGKNVERFRLESFVVGSSIMGLAGALYAHFVGFISPEAFEPGFATFLIWVMLIMGGSGSNAGALVGALLIMLIRTGTESAVRYLPPELVTQAGAMRVLLIGILLQAVLLWRPEGLLPERLEAGGQDTKTIK